MIVQLKCTSQGKPRLWFRHRGRGGPPESLGFPFCASTSSGVLCRGADPRERALRVEGYGRAHMRNGSRTQTSWAHAVQPQGQFGSNVYPAPCRLPGSWEKRSPGGTVEGMCGWRRPRARRGHGLGPQGQSSGLQVAGRSGLGTHAFLRGWGARGVLEGATSASRGRMEGVGAPASTGTTGPASPQVSPLQRPGAPESRRSRWLLACPMPASPL